jgi:hypothetical protein
MFNDQFTIAYETPTPCDGVKRNCVSFQNFRNKGNIEKIKIAQKKLAGMRANRGKEFFFVPLTFFHQKTQNHSIDYGQNPDCG